MKANIKTLVENNEWQKAFSMARKFFFGIPENDKRNIEIAADCMNGKNSFYQNIGINTDEAIQNAKRFLIKKFVQ